MPNLWDLFIKVITYGEFASEDVAEQTSPTALKDALPHGPLDEQAVVADHARLAPGYEINVDGTPMAGPSDMHGNPLGTSMGSSFSLM